jgi:SAM-dependent methyltransferase
MNNVKQVTTSNRVINCYDIPGVNIDVKTVSSFGEEWKAFHGFDEKDLTLTGDMYFDITTEEMLNDQSTVIDIGCGSGRFIKYLDGRYKKIVGLDPSQAIFATDELLGKNDKVELVMASTDNIPYPDGHFDFGYSLGVLHHIPDTEKALLDCAKKIRSGGYFLLYLYYKLENRPFYFKVLYWLSNFIRLVVSKLPVILKKWICNFLAVIFYMPFILLCRLLRFIGVSERARSYIPLQAYERQSFYVIRNDSLDRFGTPLEQRFSWEKQVLQILSFLKNFPFGMLLEKKYKIISVEFY